MPRGPGDGASAGPRAPGAPHVDTIVGISTARGPAALAVVRLSGPDSLAILARLTPGLATPPARAPRLARICDPGGGARLDQALVTFFPGPASYTGEDLVEISGHGGWLAPALVMEACLAAGARAAEPGELTRRAYLNGKLDLVQAEAVLDLVSARSRAQHQAALHQLERGLSRRVAELRERLVGLEVLLVHHVDFPGEDDPPVPLERIVSEAEELASGLDRLLDTAPEGELLREGALTVLAGLPNSGKSSLFNALLGRERAIVTEVPGTTRDALEAVVSLEGFPFRLVDTAGIRETEERIEAMGVEVARRYLAQADLVLYCVEAGREPGGAEERFLREVEGPPIVLVRTKADLYTGGEAPRETRFATGAVTVSVESGEGLGELRQLLPGLVFRGMVACGADAPVLTRERHAREARVARDEVRAFAHALREGVPAEVAATHLRPAESALEEVLGVITSEEVLDRLFREFCIGK